MKLVIIIPAYNEEEFLPKTLDSIIAQKRQPDELIVVDDNSSDQTPNIVQEYGLKNPWISLVQSDQPKGYAAGGKVVRAFYQGYKQIKTADWSVVFKLDADIELPPHYCETIMRYFEEDANVGLAGGMLQIPDGNGWKTEHFADLDHLRGALKAYRRACLEQMDGLRFDIGWDTVDELLARYYGWKVIVDPDLVAKHYRITGKKTGKVRLQLKSGRGIYIMRYGFWISSISALKVSLNKSPKILSGVYFMIGYLRAWLTGEEPLVNADQGKFIRKYRWDRMMKKLGR